MRKNDRPGNHSRPTDYTREITKCAKHSYPMYCKIWDNWLKTTGYPKKKEANFLKANSKSNPRHYNLGGC